MAVVYTLNASACPSPQAPSSLLLPGTDPAVKASLVIIGGTGAGSLSTPFNGNAAHLDNLGAAGGLWVYSVRYGGDLTDGGGLTLNISAVGAHIGAVPTVAAAQTKALTNSSNNHVWLLRDGTISLRQNVITAPASAAAYLGRVTTAGGAITVIDYSGRVEARGGGLFRRTADAGVPGDTPPSGIILLTQTAGGMYLWDGGVYRQIGPANVAESQVTPGSPVTHLIPVPAGTTGNVDITLTYKTRVLDCYLIKKSGAGGGAGTITLQNGSDPITDAMSINVADKTVVRAMAIDDAFWEVAAAGTLRAARTRTASTDETCLVVAMGVLVA